MVMDTNKVDEYMDFETSKQYIIDGVNNVYKTVSESSLSVPDDILQVMKNATIDWITKIEKDFDVSKQAEELEEYAEMCNDEVGEASSALVNMLSYTEELSPEFEIAVKKEILRQLKMFKECTKIVETEETITRKYRDLEWTHHYA
jgi:hypothetical protein